MPFEQMKIGQIVRSNAGRDTGRLYVVVGFGPPPYVLVADGRDRRIGGPKKKNVRHISVIKATDGVIAAKSASGGRITDEDLRAAINACDFTGE